MKFKECFLTFQTFVFEFRIIFFVFEIHVCKIKTLSLKHRINFVNFRGQLLNIVICSWHVHERSLKMKDSSWK